MERGRPSHRVDDPARKGTAPAGIPSSRRRRKDGGRRDGRRGGADATGCVKQSSLDFVNQEIGIRAVDVSFCQTQCLDTYFLEFFIFEIEFFGEFLELNVCLDAVCFVCAYSFFEGGDVGQLAFSTTTLILSDSRGSLKITTVRPQKKRKEKGKKKWKNFTN